MNSPALDLTTPKISSDFAFSGRQIKQVVTPVQFLSGTGPATIQKYRFSIYPKGSPSDIPFLVIRSVNSPKPNQAKSLAQFSEKGG